MVVIGGDAAGMSAASQARRRRDELEIVVLERGTRTSYAACGIPYFVAGIVEDLDDLVVRSPSEFRDRFRIDVRTRHEAVGLDLDKREVEVRDLDRERTLSLGFDQLMIATGAVPIRPDLPGIDLEFVQGPTTLDQADSLLRFAEKRGAERIVVVGGGYIGLEMAEAFCLWGADVTVVEAESHLMSTLDRDMTQPIAEAMQRHDIDVRLNTLVTGFEDGVVNTVDGSLPADLVVLGIGVQPNTALAAEAGVPLGVRGAVRVDQRQETEIEGVWSAGDCCESRHLVSGAPIHVALGTVANRQGRVAGINLGGEYATFPGVLCTAVTRICTTEVGRTGLTSAEARAAGFRFESVTSQSTTQAGYMPGARPITVRLLAEHVTGRVLGGQIVGEEGAAKRIDVIACAITAGMTVHDMIDLDLAYAPPFSPVWDPVVTAARRARRVIESD
jgi:NADPH-dependent 2,4-dienoyl-CoA reductase/sulfur reductase-like enzyme